MGSSVYPTFVPPGQHLQRLQRAYRVFTDNHNRKFGCQCDVRTQQPVEELRPVNNNPATDFTPPWLPPMRYAIFGTDMSLDFRWDYDTLAADLSEQAVDYYRRASEFALEHHKPEPELGGTVDRSIRFHLGTMPLSPAIPLACAQGDPWMLGAPGAAVNVVLREVLTQGMGSSSKEALDIIRVSLAKASAKSGVAPIPAAPVPMAEAVVPRAKSIDDPIALEAIPAPTYREFLAECRGRKMTLQEISEKWAEIKRLYAANESVSG